METKSNVSHDIKTEIPPDSMETAYFSRDFSLWAENEHSETDIYLDRGANSVQIMLYIVVPLGILLIVLILSAVMTNYSLRIEPIMLLGGQNE